MTKQQALNEYKEALKKALEKHRQYTYYCFKELNKGLSEELLNIIADTCTQAFFESIQSNLERELKLWNTN